MNDELPTYNVLHTVVNEEPLELERNGETYVPDMPQAKLEAVHEIKTKLGA